MKKLLGLAGLLLIFSISPLFAVTISDDTVSGVDRYAVYVGCNYGGKSRERLLYAGSDALSFKVTMAEIGGVTEANSRILIDPTKESVDKALDDISKAILESTNNSKRSEFIFYYSGHSDENSLLLGEAKYDYSKLKAAITAVPSDIHVVILDSCYSGNFIRTKGGQKRKPFLIDDSSVVTGHAYLSSSSDNESSQESDEIESSYFTNAMITGLRGAADASGDNKVTLNELYSYAFNDTLSKTESSKAGPQHPNYNITLVGSGDLILSDLSNAESMLSLSKEAKGKFIIRDVNDKLISEINKSQGQPIFMALPSGQYSALIIDEYSTRQGTFLLEKDQVYVLDQNSLSSIKRKSNRLRGDSQKTEEKSEDISVDDDDEDFLSLEDLEDTKEIKASGRNISVTKTTENLEALEDLEDEEEILDLSFNNKSEVEEALEDLSSLKDSDNIKNMALSIYDNYSSFNLSFVPGLYFVGDETENSLFSIGIIGSKAKNIGALQASNVFNIATGNVFGGQIGGIFNISIGNLYGGQGAGLFNIGKNTSGGQFAGLFNISKNMLGIQGAGFMNIAEQIEGMQISGFTNIAKNIDGMQIASFLNYAENIDGTQISGFMNTAKNVNGVQIGIINIAEVNNGITLGLLNYVEKGLHDLSIGFDSDDCIDIFYQGGSKHLFTTFGFTKPRDDFFEDISFGSVYLGIGTEFTLPNSSIDIEGLWKFVYSNDDEDLATDLAYNYSKADIEEKIYSCSIPSVKITWNIFEGDSARMFLSCAFDMNYAGWNDYAFSVYKKNWLLETDSGNVSPTFSFGFKVKI